MGKGSPPSQPAHTTQTTTSEYPTELKPFIKDIFGKAKGIEEQRSSQGYQPYTGPRIAGFNQDQQDAFTGIRETQGASTPYFDAQETLIERSTAGPSAERTAQYMNPYTQNVIDQQLRELGRRGTQERQRIGARAAGAGGFGGSRQAILEAEQMRNQAMRGDDIQARGLNQAFNQAQQAMAQADARGLQGAGMFGQMATQVPGQRFKELGALAGVGAADQTQQQRALDLGFQQFRDEYNFPMQTLNEYSSILRGFPLPANQTTNQTAYSAVAPLSSQLLGAGAGLTGIAGMAGLFGASGGQVKKLQQGGLASRYVPTNRVRMGKTNYADIGTPTYREDEEDEGGFSNSPAKKLIDYITATPSNLMKIIYDTASVPQELIGDFIGQDLDTDFTDLTETFIGEDNTREMKEQNPALNLDTEFQDYPTRAGDAEIMEMDKLVDKKAEERNKKEVAEEKKATLDERRMRMATFAPLLKNARAIAEAPTLTSALLGGLETAGESLAGRVAADEAVISRAAALRAADIAEMKSLAGITKDLSRDDLAIEFLKVAGERKNRGDIEGAAAYEDAANQLKDGSINFSEEIFYLQNKDKVLDAIKAASEVEKPPQMMFKEGGRVKEATPERSFDFIRKDGKLIAVPK